MNDADPPRVDPMTPSGAGRLEDVCDRFEAAWRAGERPQIEEYWSADRTAPLGRLLMRELLLVEMAYRRALGESPRPDDYTARFPDETEAILDAFTAYPTAGAPADAADTGIASEFGAATKVVDPEVAVKLAQHAFRRASDPSASVPAAVGALTSSGRRFRVVRLLGRGGLGEVYVAFDEELRREVALKVIHGLGAADAGNRTRFLVEAELTGRLEHPGVVPVYGLGWDDAGQPFYAMRLIRGESLKEAVARFHAADQLPRDPAERELALRGLLKRFVDVCNAVAYAHSRGVLHRDLKPQNIMLGPYGETLVVDWGLARAAGHSRGMPGTPDEPLRPEAGGNDPTLPGSQLGTPQYMSPEQAAGRPELHGPASDVYSLGATLYHLLTGHAPFENADVVTTLEQVRSGEFPAPRSVNGRVPAALDAVCRKAMALEPQDRYASARALADEIEHWLADEPVCAFREPVHARLARWARRHKPAVVGAAALLVTALVALSVSTALMSREAKRREALRQLAEANLRDAHTAVDQMLTEAAEVELAEMPQMQAVQRTLLDRASAFYTRFLAQRRTDPAIRREAGVAHVRLGEIAERLGDHVESERAYRQGLAILGDVVRDHPTWDEALRDLGRAHDGLGMLLKKSNRFRESEAELRTSLKLRARLSADHADNRADQQGLADTRYHLAALISRLQGRRSEDETAYREALRIQQSLVASSRENPAHRRKLARYLDNLGKLLASTSRLDQAEAAYREAVAAVEGFVATGPPAPGDRWLLAQCHANLAMALRTAGRLAEAEAACLKARGLEEALRSDFPDVPDYKYELASILNNLGLLWAAKDPSRADLVYRQALELEEALTTEFPRRPDYQLGLAVTRLNRAAVLERLDVRQAERTYRDALAIHERLNTDFPEVPEYRLDLGRTLYSLGRLLLAGNDPGGARAFLARAIQLHRAVLELDQQNQPAREFLRDDQAVICLALLRSGAHAQAADAAAELPRIVEEGPSEYLRAAAFLVQCAKAAASDSKLPESDRPAQAAAYAVRAVAVLRQGVSERWIRDSQQLSIEELAPLWPRDDFQELKKEIERRSAPPTG
jgi:serine/threonine-protein kinase